MRTVNELRSLSAQELASELISDPSRSYGLQIKDVASKEDEHFRNRFSTFLENPDLLDAEPKPNARYVVAYRKEN